MSDTLQAVVTPPPTHDERVRRRSRLARLFARPEAGALAGAIVIYIFFFIVAPPFRNANSFSTVLYVSSTYGLMATPIALLMIGGEFDLSAGVAVTTAALTASLFSFEFTANVWVGVAVALVIALLVGFINGWIVTRTGIPSFLVTWARSSCCEGLNLALTRTITNQVASPDISNIEGFSSAKAVFATSFDNRRGERQHHGDLLDRLRPDRDVDPAPHPCRQLDLLGRRERAGRPRGRACRSAG